MYSSRKYAREKTIRLSRPNTFTICLIHKIGNNFVQVKNNLNKTQLHANNIQFHVPLEWMHSIMAILCQVIQAGFFHKIEYVSAQYHQNKDKI